MDPIIPTCNSSRFRVAALGVALLALGACAQLREVVQVDRDYVAHRTSAPPMTQEAERPSDQLFGSYLSARVAGAERDPEKAAEFYSKALTLDPDNSVILDQAFLHEIESGNMKRSVERAREIVGRDPDKRLAQLVVALDDVKRGDYESARTHLTKAGTGPFNQLASDLVSAWTLEAQGRTDDAVKTLKDGSDPSAFQLYYLMHKALILDQAGRKEAADRAYQKVIASGGGDSLRVIQAYGQLLESGGRGPEAASLYKAYSGDEPMHPLLGAAAKRLARGEKPGPMIATPQAGVAEVLYGLASALAQDRSIDLPIVYLNLALYVDPQCDVALLLLGDINNALHRYAEANVIYGKIARSSPLHVSAEISSAMNLDRLGDNAQATRILQDIVAHDPTNLRALISLGDVLRNHDRDSDAIAAYSRAIDAAPQNDPNYWSLYFARAVTYERTGQWPEAEADLQQALKLSPGEPSVLNYLGYSWVEQGKHTKQAIKMIEAAVEQRPNDGFIVDSLGWAQFKLGHFESAVDTLQHAVGLEPQDATINAHLGDAYWRIGRMIEARFQWKRALSLGASGADAQALQDKIDFGLNGAQIQHTDKGPAAHDG